MTQLGFDISGVSVLQEQQQQMSQEMEVLRRENEELKVGTKALKDQMSKMGGFMCSLMISYVSGNFIIGGTFSEGCAGIDVALNAPVFSVPLCTCCALVPREKQPCR